VEAPVVAPTLEGGAEVSLDEAIGLYGDAHMCEVVEDGWVECPEVHCDRPDHTCRGARAFAAATSSAA